MRTNAVVQAWRTGAYVHHNFTIGPGPSAYASTCVARAWVDLIAQTLILTWRAGAQANGQLACLSSKSGQTSANKRAAEWRTNGIILAWIT